MDNDRCPFNGGPIEVFTFYSEVVVEPGSDSPGEKLLANHLYRYDLNGGELINPSSFCILNRRLLHGITVVKLS